ncbi:MAG: hypothetical protein GX896_05855 [Clostridiales bacterium]|nr:hypothetical protein [Clostridiales bacterium]
MTTVKIEYKGKTILASVSDEVADDLRKTGKGLIPIVIYDLCTYIDNDGSIHKFSYCNSQKAKDMFESGSGFTNEQLAKDHIRARKINRKLLEYIAEHNAKPLDWTVEAQDKFFIYYDYDTGELAVDFNLFCKDLNQLYFETEESARNAIEKFKDDLIWHITEFQPYLGAYE